MRFGCFGFFISVPIFMKVDCFFCIRLLFFVKLESRRVGWRVTKPSNLFFPLLETNLFGYEMCKFGVFCCKHWGWLPSIGRNQVIAIELCYWLSWWPMIFLETAFLKDPPHSPSFKNYLLLTQQSVVWQLASEAGVSSLLLSESLMDSSLAHMLMWIYAVVKWPGVS